jgi:8-oxo-dGTP pyrophosphatase MutT (NUDIX family)
MTKVCPVVLRLWDGQREILAFHHPTAGTQIIRGTLDPGEALPAAALRELHEESGIVATSALALGNASVGAPPDDWHFFLIAAPDLPHRWAHPTTDDHGHTFCFFWHPLDRQPGADWHPVFHDALRHIRACPDQRA